MARHDPRHATPAQREAPASPAGAPDDPVYVFSRQSVREVDRLAIAEFGIPSIILMENAALHLAEVTLDALDDAEGSRVLILCGPGNNGGDGLAAARHLHNARDSGRHRPLRARGKLHR
jgi:NAD(P)H-hydrate repair Nnr-like enzyme with NAD(P)H-hydrate epimerase domain